MGDWAGSVQNVLCAQPGDSPLVAPSGVRPLWQMSMAPCGRATSQREKHT